ncbi:MAG: hypothetical protein PHV34_24230 [Verrucomicrobiae bacterium]|nr:hypothetical protein [Verrucomicrobiae bacterium]
MSTPVFQTLAYWVRFTSGIPAGCFLLQLFIAMPSGVSELTSLMWVELLLITLFIGRWSQEAFKLCWWLPLGIGPFAFFWIFSRLIEGRLVPFP